MPFVLCCSARVYFAFFTQIRPVCPIERRPPTTCRFAWQLEPGTWALENTPGAGFLQDVAPVDGVLPHRPHVDVPQIRGVLGYCGRFKRSFTTSTGRAKPAWGLVHRPEMQLVLPRPRGNLPGRADARLRDLACGGTGLVACISARRPQ